MIIKKIHRVVFFILLGVISVFGEVQSAESSQAGSLAKNAERQNQKPALRAVTPEDFQNLERLWETSLSPDGQWLAYTITRSEASGVSSDRDARLNLQRTEVWVVSTAGGSASKIAGGDSGVMGFWRMAWSPDSQRLALCSATPEGYVGLWLWEKSSGKLHKLVESTVAYTGILQWISEKQILVTIAPAGKRWPQVAGFSNAIERAKSAWAKGLAGREASVSVLDSGSPLVQPQQPEQDKLLLIDVQSGAQRTVLAANNCSTSMAVSANYLACLSQMDTSQIPKDVDFGARPLPPLGLKVVTLDGRSLAGTEQAKDIVPFSLRWSQDGSQLALMGRSRMAADAQIEIFIYRPESQTLIPMNTRGVPLVADYTNRRSPKMIWTTSNELLVYGQPEPLSRIRSDWWIISEKEQPRNLTSGMKVAPSALLPERDGQSLLGIAQGKLWRLHVDGSTPQDLSGGMAAMFTSIFWPSITARQFDGKTQETTGILLSSERTRLPSEGGEDRNALPGEKGAELNLLAFDLTSGKFTRLEPPGTGVTFRGFSPKSDTVVYTSDDRTGTHLWLTRSSAAKVRLVHETNTFVHEIAEPQWKKIQYRSLDGAELTGWVLLPFGYQEGKRYPLVARVYMGNEYGSAPPEFEGINETIGDHQGILLAAHGYAVLFPSMPRLPRGVANDSYMELTKGVLPAVDKVIDVGIADPHRLGVLGESYGGFSTYGLITQTKRFQAAVAMAGPSNWISLWGQFDGATRYDVAPQSGASLQSFSEAGQGALGAAPWRDVERYIRNSPIFYADRVETPVLIIQGDMDYVPIQQGEEFFMAMYRQGKRARFLRYWTSGHVPGGANEVDMWKQIYAWFDEFLMKPEKTEGSKQ